MRQEQAPHEWVTTGDDRRLAVDVAGAPDGSPVFLLHGTPGSRKGPRPRGIVLHRLGVRLVSYDRPGYGDSDRMEGRSIADAAADVAAIADHLGIERFAIVGRSGGGPHALACAALLGRRVTRAAVLVSLAPSDASDLNWFDGMDAGNVTEYSTADADHGALLESLTTWADRTQEDPRDFFGLLEPALTAPDRRVVQDVALRRLLMSTYAEALHKGPAGWIDDVLALRRKWQFDLSEITAETRLWHGADDTFSPASHTRWLAERIPCAEVEIERGIGHFGAVEVLPRMLRWLTQYAEALTPAMVRPQFPRAAVPSGTGWELRKDRAGRSVDRPVDRHAAL